MLISIPKGVFDIVPQSFDNREIWKNSELWQHIESAIRKVARNYGFKEIRTPVFERTELFQRSVGESSDIVSKEMYTFFDKGGRSMTLRPEGTAPVMRSIIERKAYNHLSVQKLFYISPMFRYERPQAGRFRQHHQFGVEAIGNAVPEQDAEVIDMLYALYESLGLKDLSVYLNSLGDKESRDLYRKALKDYFFPYLSDLSSESQSRFELNPLRILDSKDEKDRDIAAGAPIIIDYLNKESREHFSCLKKRLDKIGISYEVDPNLVRGLDYYNKTVFEIVSGKLGAQNSIGAGGRYDGLIKSLGGPDLPAVGFGTGMERIVQTMIGQKAPFPEASVPECFFVPLGERAKAVCMQLLQKLRKNDIVSEMDFSGRKLKHVMRYADGIQARYVAVVGESELEKGSVELKDMRTGEFREVSLDDFLSSFLAR